jgi:hypothetical protein
VTRRQQDRGRRRAGQPDRAAPGEGFVQEDKDEADGQRRVQGGEDDGGRQQLPLGGEQVQGETEHGSGSGSGEQPVGDATGGPRRGGAPRSASEAGA